MSSLSMLPNECLLLIYQSLADFDEVFALAQSWRQSLAVYRRHEYSILCSMILRSDTYEHDLSLCLVLEENLACSATRNRTTPPPSKRVRRERSILARCLFGTKKDLTRARVRAIVDRWRLVAKLQTLYLDQAVHAEYRRYTTCSGTLQIDELLSIFTGSEPVRDNDDDAWVWSAKPPIPMTLRFDDQQKQRFYRAFTGLWLAVHARRLVSVSGTSTPMPTPHAGEATTATTPSAGIPPDLALLNQLWLGGEDRSLLESMDMLEVYDFLYGFLLGNISALSAILPQKHKPRLAAAGTSTTTTNTTDVNHPSTIWTRDALIQFCHDHLHPPHLNFTRLVVYEYQLQLSHRNPPRNSSHDDDDDDDDDPRNHPHHPIVPMEKHTMADQIVIAGLNTTFDPTMIGITTTVITTTNDRHRHYPYAVRRLELAVELNLSRTRLFGPDPNAAANVWTCYRKYCNKHSRGRQFWCNTASKDIVDDIKRYAKEAQCLTRHPFFVRLSRFD
ncbi:MAG: hypothetical protein M1823_001432 [Watsoniomyces obsoletus]|nr:MAG: hypothetical protein M1823_001432 [Watsoniomyces obsoletus]